MIDVVKQQEIRASPLAQTPVIILKNGIYVIGEYC